MRKFINYFICSIVFMLCCGVFASCSSDDDGPRYDVEGVWEAPGGESITFNNDKTGVYSDNGTTHSFEWTMEENAIVIMGSDGTTTKIYYRIVGGKLLLYRTYNDYENNNPSNSFENQGGTNEGVGSLIGKWGMSGYLDGDYVTSSMTFQKNGKVIVEETFRDYPEDSYTVTVNYSVEGSLSRDARLEIWGKTVDGDYIEMTYLATIDGNRLELIGISGECKGDRLTLKRM